MKKQLLSILLCLIMVVGLLPTAALAEEAAPAFDKPAFDLTRDLKDITIPNDLVTCICTKTNESRSYGQLPGGFSASQPLMEDGVWTVIISVEKSVYKAQFDKDTGSTHSQDSAHPNDFINQIQFKLKYEQNKWMLLGEMPKNKMLHFTCSGGHVYQGDIPVIELVTRTHTDIKVTENDKWEYSIDNGETWQGSSQFTNLRPGTEYTIIARVKATATHKPSANSAPLKISTIGSAITEEDLTGLNIPENLVTVKCQKTDDSKKYGRIPGGFDLSNSTPYKDDDDGGVLKAIVKLNLSAYKDKYDADTGKTHENAGVEGNTHAAFTLKYVNDKWELDGKFPAVVLLVTCNGNHENQITFDGNGGKPTNSTMTTTGKKLASLPTATRSGRYSFDGWYTERNGGTKITTATVFERDTTVYAHWTYTGSTGGGVTTYPITVKSAKNGDVTASHKSAAKGTTITLTVDPDKGYVLDTLTVLDGKDKEIKLTEKNGKYTFTMPASKVTVAAMFKAEQSTGKNPFTDVPAGSYYEDAVIWAVDKGITTGTSATTFNPNGICTRAQAVTFLWRAAGSPAAKSSAMPFADVKAGSYYETAVLWAVENGITKGTSDTMFSPDATCTRAQIVTFLWRSQKSPAAGMANPFADVAADTYYIDAVLWAVKHNITVGTTFSIFSPDEECTRAQIVTFLYRARNK